MAGTPDNERPPGYAIEWENGTYYILEWVVPRPSSGWRDGHYARRAQTKDRFFARRIVDALLDDAGVR